MDLIPIGSSDTADKEQISAVLSREVKRPLLFIVKTECMCVSADLRDQIIVSI